MFTVTKSFHKLPTAHCQFQDVCEDGSPGQCASLHGYDRSVTIKIGCTELDPYGWVYPFGHFKQIRKWLEYYFDHTSVFPANDPRMVDIKRAIDSGIISTARILPYGVSMEMSALFLFEQVNGYINQTSNGRCGIVDIEFREHDSNAGSLSIPLEKSIKIGSEISMAQLDQLVMKPEWDFEIPQLAIQRIGLN